MIKLSNYKSSIYCLIKLNRFYFSLFLFFFYIFRINTE